jgi:hypothetical protein
MSTDQQIKQEIKDKWKTAARVTPIRIHALVKDAYYFTAAEGVLANASTHPTNSHPTYSIDPTLGLLTFCVLVLENGFTVTGESACVSPENFDASLGQKIAMENALDKIWPIEGYLLKQKLHEGKSS